MFHIYNLRWAITIWCFNALSVVCGLVLVISGITLFVRFSNMTAWICGAAFAALLIVQFTESISLWVPSGGYEDLCMTDVRQVGVVGRLVVSVLVGLAATLVFLAIGLAGAKPGDSLLMLPLCPAIELARAATGSEDVLPVFYAAWLQFAICSFVAWAIWRLRPSTHRIAAQQRTY